MKVCRICLFSEGRLYALKKQLNSLYEQLTGLDNKQKKLPQWVCAECGLRLISYDKLRQKSLRSHELLCQILNKSKNITKKNLQQIKNHCPGPSLSYSNMNLVVYNPTDDNINIDNVKEQDPTTINDSDTLELLTLKEEEEELIDESLEIKPEIENSQETYSYESLEMKSEIESPQQAFSYELRYNLDSIEAEYCDIEYLDDEDGQETQSNASLKSDQDYVPSDSSSKPPSTKKARLKKLPVKGIEKKVKVQPEDELKKYFKITQLSLEEQVGEIERRKDMPEYTAANYKCDFCFKWFTGKEAYDDHMFKHSLESGKFECRVCRARFKTPYAQKHHSRRTHGQLFKCNSCAFVTTVRGSAVRHGKLHTGALYLCPHCVRQFNDVTVYWRHMRVRHSTCSDVCAMCGYAFLSAKGLRVHWLRKHRGFNSEMPMDGPRCEKCSVTFASEEAYYTHIRVSVKHKDDGTNVKPRRNAWRILRKPKPCEECGLQLDNFKAYISHFRRSHPDKTRTQYFSTKAAPCMCELCGQLVQHSSALGDHMNSTHGNDRTRIHKCNDCPKTFSQALYLVKHCKEAHNKVIESPSDGLESPWQCRTCSKVMSSKASLRVHRKLHDVHRQRRFPCEHCGKAFYSNSRLKCHMIIHQDRFRCKVCQKGFFSNCDLAQHIISLHSKK